MIVRENKGEKIKLRKSFGNKKIKDTCEEFIDKNRNGEFGYKSESGKGGKGGKGKKNDRKVLRTANSLGIYGLNREVRINKGEGESLKKSRYMVKTNVVERIVLDKTEHLKIDLFDIPNKQCDLGIYIVDGMGNECENEFNIADNYLKVIDESNGKLCKIKDNMIKNIGIENGIIKIQMELSDKLNKTLKFMYYLEVKNDL